MHIEGNYGTAFAWAPLPRKIGHSPRSCCYPTIVSALPRAPLMPFDGTGRMAAAIPFAFDDYLELVDATGRVIREDKRGFIPGETPRILERLNIDPVQFIATAGRMLTRRPALPFRSQPCALLLLRAAAGVQ